MINKKKAVNKMGKNKMIKNQKNQKNQINQKNQKNLKMILRRKKKQPDLCNQKIRNKINKKKKLICKN